MKQLLLRTKLGSWLLETRNKINLLKLALTRLETISTLSNDILSVKLITKICQPEMVFIDIGSHIGSIISEVQRHNDSIKIIGVEAIPEKVVNLRKTFPSVDIFECALGDKNEVVSFYVNEQESGCSSLLAPQAGLNGRIREIKVSLKKLDDLAEFYNVDAIKIDVEGAELGVILGARETIVKNKPIIMFESTSADKRVKEELWDRLTSLQYGIHLPNRLAYNDVAMSKEGFIDSHVYPRFTTNYFAVPFEKRLEYRDKARSILGIEPQPQR